MTETCRICGAIGYKRIEVWEGKELVPMCKVCYESFKDFVLKYGEGIEFKEEDIPNETF